MFDSDTWEVYSHKYTKYVVAKEEDIVSVGAFFARLRTAMSEGEYLHSLGSAQYEDNNPFANVPEDMLSVSGDLLEEGMRKAEGMMAMKMAGGGLSGKLVSTTLAVFQAGVESYNESTQKGPQAAMDKALVAAGIQIGAVILAWVAKEVISRLSVQRWTL